MIRIASIPCAWLARALVAIVLVAGSAATAEARPAHVDEAAMTARVFSAPSVDRGWFADPAFAFPGVFDDVRSAVAGCHRRFGGYVRTISMGRHDYKIELEHGVCYTEVELDGHGKIDAISMFEPTPRHGR